jgi:DNA-binding NtrC family response regulator
MRIYGGALRLISDNSSSESPPSAGTAPYKRNGAQRKTTILVVEDEVLIRMAVSEYLRDAGYRVLDASNVAEAQAVFTVGEPVELVFSDVIMPGEQNGFDLAEWVQTQYPDVQVLLASGVAEIAKNAGYTGAHGPLITKPYSLEVVLELIKRLLRP